MAVDLDKIDKVDTNITVPSVDDKLMETEKDKWGIILNNAFNILNNNIKIYKEIILELANTQNSLDLSDILLRLKNLEIDRDSIESIVNNNNSEYIDVGIIERKLNLKGTELEFNSNKVDLDNVAYTNRENTFSENINNTKVYKLKGGTVLENIDNKIKIGNISNKLDLQTTDGTFLVNGEEFRLSSEEVKALLDTTDFQATETINGTSKIATQTEVDAGLEDTKIVTSKKLKARLDSLLAGITSTYVELTRLATETTNGISKLATQIEVDAGLEDTKIVTSKKLKARLDTLLAGITSTYVLKTDNASETVKGVSKYGTSTGTVLEGKRLAEIIGLEYGGNIQDTGAKVTGEFYYDKALKYYYECIVNNNLTYNDGSKFRAISNKPISDKVENLYKVSEIVEVPNSVFSTVKFWRYGNRAFLFVFFDYKNSREVNWMTEGITLINYPANFTPDTPFLNTEHVILSNNNLNKNIARLVLRNDKITIHGVEGMTHYELKGIISYMTK